MAKNDNIQDLLKDVADAIREKKGTTDLINPQNFSAEIKDIKSGGGGESQHYRDVNFYDYDGTILHSYSWEEFVAKAEMPPLPTHRKKEGLICQEWNYTLEEVLQQGGKCDVGATYITDDGATRFYVSIDNENAKDMQLYFSTATTADVTIDWGDGNITTREKGGERLLHHRYEALGDYVISLKITNDGYIVFGADNANNNVLGSKLAPSYGRYNALRRVEIGRGISIIDYYTFRMCYSLESITLPNSVKTLQGNSFYNCVRLKHLTIPRSVTTMGNSLVQKCLSLISVSLATGAESLPPAMFSDCVRLRSITIPNSVKSLGANLLSTCSDLRDVSIQGNITSLSGDFIAHCLLIPAFTIPDSVTVLGNYVLYDCANIQHIDMSPNIESIGTAAFMSQPLMKYYDFRRATRIPVLQNSNAFGSTTGQFIVPDDLYDEWAAATNWTTYASRIIKASEFVES